MIQKSIHIGLVLLLLVFANGCATYYDKSRGTERALISGDYESAKKKITDSKFLSKKRNALLYNLELGRVCHLLGEFEESNIHLNRADKLIEEYRSMFEMAVGITVNPSLQPYQAEPHEQIMMHFYKSMNYLQLGDMEAALVEVRRLDLKEKAMDIAAKGKEKKYSQDAFGLMLMGMIYEASGDFNNAFIAYRNAKLVYESDLTGLYSGNKPASLEQDLLRTAKRSGIFYESDTRYDANYAPNGELILFYESGLSPVKAEQNYFFALSQNATGFFFQSGSIIVPVDYNFNSNNSNFNPADLGLIRLAFPYYVSRGFNNQLAQVNVNGKQISMQVAEDISAIAFQIEKDNFFKNLGKDLVRLTIKKITEMALAEKNEYAGAALGIANAVSEKADTRNWQSLPGQVQFVRIPLDAGTNKISVSSNGTNHSFELEGNGKIVFRNISAN